MLQNNIIAPIPLQNFADLMNLSRNNVAGAKSFHYALGSLTCEWIVDNRITCTSIASLDSYSNWIVFVSFSWKNVSLKILHFSICCVPKRFKCNIFWYIFFLKITCNFSFCVRKKLHVILLFVVFQKKLYTIFLFVMFQKKLHVTFLKFEGQKHKEKG